MPLSPMSGGVNRFEKESAPTQASECLNVINKEGSITRRGGMSTFAVGAPHHLPAGATTLIKTIDGANTVITHREGAVPSVQSFYVGCDEQFDGIDWPGSSDAGGLDSLPPNDSHYLEAQYWNGSAWTDIPFIHDTTAGRPTVAAGTTLTASQRTVSLSLTQHGYISWHTSEHLSDWATTIVEGVTKYYVKLILKSAEEGAATFAGTTINNPGVRVFKLPPVNGLFPVKLKDRAVLVIGTDRARRGGATRRGVEQGAQIAYHFNDRTKPETAILVEDEGAATIGQATNHAGVSGWNVGTASKLEKRKKIFFDEDLNERTYAWLFDSTEPRQGQFLGHIIRTDLVKTAMTPTTTNLKLEDSGGTEITDDYENCRLRVITSTGSGPAVGEEREIIRYDAVNGYTVYPAFSAAPDALNTFAIYAPHSFVRYDADVDYTFGSGATVTRQWEIASHDADTVVPVDGSSLYYAQDPDVSTFQMVDFEIGKELRWTTTGGRRWTGAYDSMTGQLILANGECPLLTFDGRRMRQLVADDSSAAANELAGKLPPEAYSGLAPSASPNAEAYFRPVPPIGSFVVDFMGRLVVADPKSNIVAWSMPGLFNDIWPLGFEYQVRDDENNAITGMATLYDKLFVFTSSAIFASGPADNNGQYGFYRVSHGVGFTSHHAVQRISTSGSSTLIGPAADGVYVFNGSEPTAILDDWKRVLPDGVNRSAMDDACATVSLSDNLYYLAVPAAGSDKNNRILVFDWVRKDWWVYTAPFGVASLATDYDENGNERVLIGSYDGHVAQFTSSNTDDGSAITGTAKSISVSPLGSTGQECSFVALNVDMKNMGIKTVSVNTYTDRQTVSREASSGLTKTLKVDSSQSIWGVGRWGTAKWADDRTKTVRLMMPAAARGHTVQYEITGTSPWRLNSAVIFIRPLGSKGRR